jgi:hypothetical protein
MSIKLEEKLASIPCNYENTREWNEMLDNVNVSISWNGKRLVSAQGYIGEVEINVLVRRYLESIPYHQDPSCPLEEKLNCYNVWDKVNHLCVLSDKELSTTLFYKYLIGILESNVAEELPLQIVKLGVGGEIRASIFEFAPKKFKELWPDQEPISKSWPIGPLEGEGSENERWRANKEMVEAAIRASSKLESS